VYKKVRKIDTFYDLNKVIQITLFFKQNHTTFLIIAVLLNTKK